jgi:hypothetical protein
LRRFTPEQLTLMLQDIRAELGEVERSALHDEPELNELTVSEETVTKS